MPATESLFKGTVESRHWHWPPDPPDSDAVDLEPTIVPLLILVVPLVAFTYLLVLLLNYY